MPFTQLTPTGAQTNYSFGLPPACLLSNNSYTAELNKEAPDGSDQCSIEIAGTGIFLIGASTALKTLHNISNTQAVLTHYADEKPYTFLGVPPSKQPANRDFTAHTFGAHTHCNVISKQCNLETESGGTTPFKCSDAFSGDVTADTQPWHMAFFTDGSMSNNETYAGVDNPFHFAIATSTSFSGGGSVVADGEDVVTPMHGGYAFVLGCSSSILDIEYDVVNGSVTRFEPSLSNASVSNIWQTVMANTRVAYSKLEQAASLSIFGNSTQDLADIFAESFSRISLAVGSGALRPEPGDAVQHRRSFLVTRVPVAPLLCLVIANLLFVVLGILLGGIALVTSRSETRDVQARLTVSGLVADRFEGERARRRVGHRRELFEESEGRGSMRAGIDRAAASGYEYKVWQNKPPVEMR